jgi:hypothetical protein
MQPRHCDQSTLQSFSIVHRFCAPFSKLAMRHIWALCSEELPCHRRDYDVGSQERFSRLIRLGLRIQGSVHHLIKVCEDFDEVDAVHLQE